MIWILGILAVLIYLVLGCMTLVVIMRGENTIFGCDIAIVILWPILIIAMVIAVIFLVLRDIVKNFNRN